MSAVSIKFMPNSTALLSTDLASSGSSGSPQIPGPVMRIAPKPRRFTLRSPRASVPAAAAWKVGELARRTGLSVRALRYYDEIGLLSPSWRTEGGHRLYTGEDVVRLQRIKSLRALGFTLREVREYLDGSEVPLERVIELHLVRLKERIELQRRLCDRLERVAARLRSGEEVSSERFVETIMEVIEMSERLDKYYRPEQLEYLEERRREVGEERIRAAEA